MAVSAIQWVAVLITEDVSCHHRISSRPTSNRDKRFGRHVYKEIAEAQVDIFNHHAKLVNRLQIAADFMEGLYVSCPTELPPPSEAFALAFGSHSSCSR